MMGQRHMISKLLGKQSNDNRSDSNAAFDARIDPFPRPDTCQSASLHVGGTLRCLDKSPTGNLVVVAGEQVFKILKVEGSNIVEESDLRVTIANQAHSEPETTSSLKDRLNIRAARWMHGKSHTTIIAASAHGKITLYDINRISTGSEVGRIKEHFREIHTLAVNPYRSESVLTACHDGTIRLFDILEPDRIRGQVFRSKNKYKANADGIRDVKWSPTRGLNFACATNNGAVQLWDRRNPNAPVVNLKTAHRNACMSISWHYDGAHIISGGQDQKAHVWELLHNSDKRQGPKFTFSTPAPISRVSWRPPCWSSTAQGRRAAQIAIAYDDQSPMNTKISALHVWDLARPSLPFKEIGGLESSLSAFVWHDRDQIWSVSANGKFDQIDMAFAPKTIDRRSLSTFDISPSGEALMCLEERRSRLRLSSADSYDERDRKDINKSQSQSHSRSPRRLSIQGSRSDSDEDVVGSFLGGKTRRHTRRQSFRTNQNMSTTPPSGPTGRDEDMGLMAAVDVTGSYKSPQIMAFGNVAGTADRNIYRFISSACLEAIATDKLCATTHPDADSHLDDRLKSVLNDFATAAQDAGRFRLAQTWRLFAYTMHMCLSRRAIFHRNERLAKFQRQSKDIKPDETAGSEPIASSVEHHHSDHDTKKFDYIKSPTGSASGALFRSVLSEELESTSNMTTPQARPLRDSQILSGINKISTVEDDDLSLPPSVHMNSQYETPHIQPSSSSVETVESSSEGYDFYDMASVLSPAIDISVPPTRKKPFKLDFDPKHQVDRDTPMTRHDSIDSFEMFSTSQESSQRLPNSLTQRARRDSNATFNQRKSSIGISWDSNITADSRVEQSLDAHRSAKAARYSSPHGPIVDTEDASLEAQRAAMQNARLADEKTAAQSQIDMSNTFIIDSDYYPQPSDPPFVPDPIDPHVLFQRTIEYEIQSGVLNAALMLLTIKPFLGDNTIDEYQASAILAQYHHRLISMELFYEAALLRKLTYPEFRNTYNQGLDNTIIGLMCPSCKRSVGDVVSDSVNRLKYCSACKIELLACAICQESEPPDEDLFDVDRYQKVSSSPATPKKRGSLSKSALYTKVMPSSWWYCQGCGHGGHTKCMQDWHGSPVLTSPLHVSNDANVGESVSDGCCPLEGCLHPCLPGKYRDDFLNSKRQMSEQASRSARSSRNPSLSGIDSRDLKGVSGLGFGFESIKRVNSTGVIREEARSSDTTRRSLHTSAGLGTLERKKSVKVIAPGEEDTR